MYETLGIGRLSGYAIVSAYYLGPDAGNFGPPKLFPSGHGRPSQIS